MASLVNNLGGTLGFGENALVRNDDSFQSGIDLTALFGEQGLNFFGTNYSYASINNNGNITLSNSSSQGLQNYTPFGLAHGGYAIIAPFFADVDTRLNGGTASADQVEPTAGGTSRGSDLVWYDLDTTGNGALTVTWDDVGYFDHKTNALNAFQLEIRGKGDGNFDAIFRYEDINWTTGDYSGGSGGLGGTVARAGYSTGDGASWYELAQSGLQDAILDLENTPGNTGVSGYYIFSVQSGSTAGETLDGTLNDDLISGGEGNDTINGLAGNDYLIGNEGADSLVGATGDDTYTVDADDSVVELDGGGVDTVVADISYVLGSNLENLRLTGLANINGSGNAAANVLSGNSANNTLDGMGGDDTVDYALASGAIVVDLSLTGPQSISGEGDDTLRNIENLVGSMFDDQLRGTDGANVLDGNLGADTMTGGAGDDTYYVDDAGDLVVESGAGGDDTVNSRLDAYTLGDAVENGLIFTERGASLNGNSLDNVLGGGAGNDTFSGDDGNDTFLFGLGSGQDTVLTDAGDAGMLDTIQLGAGIAAADVMLERPPGSDDLLLTLAGASDSLTVKQYFDGHNSVVLRFADGTEWDGGQIDALFHVDSPASGALQLSGAAQEGGTLSAALVDADDADGLTGVAYQWQVSEDGAGGWSDVDGANGTSFGIASDQSQVGHYVRALATSSDALGGSTLFTSAALQVANVNDAPSGAVSIGGSAAQGATLTAANTLADADGLGALSYQWLAGGAAIAGATGASLTLGQAQVGAAISVRASYTDALGAAESRTSAATAAVANLDDAAHGALSVSGTAQEGGTLTASLGGASDADGLTGTSYRWQISDDGSSGWSDVSGASGASFGIAADQSQVGKYLRALATTSDAFGGGTVFTGAAALVANVNDVHSGGVSIGGEALQGATLTALSTLADADGIGALSYQWLRGGAAISGATGASYLLGAADVGQSIAVRASYTDAGGTLESALSAASGSVAAATPVSGTPGVLFSNAANLVTTESGGTAAFQVALQGTPRHDVVLTLTISDTSEGVFQSNGAASISLTFTAANWSVAQTVTVAGVDDKPLDGEQPYVISTAVSSEDLRYDGMRSGTGMAIANITLANTDDDATDELYGDAGGVVTADLLHGGNGASDVYGREGRDEIYGGNGDDRLYGGYGDDVLSGEADDDQLEGDQGNDKLNGGSGNDTLTGGTGKDTLTGGAGNDVLDGSSDADSMDGGNGADTYYADNAGDVITDSGSDGALDTVYLTAYLAGGYTLGTGIDNGTLSAQANDATLSGNAGNNSLTGNVSDNSLNGGDGADTLDGGAGNDVLYAGSGDDWVNAGDGNDLIVGGDGAGNDRYAGGAGSDTVKYISSNAGITVNLATGRASGADIGSDILSQIENVIGGKGSDLITGSAAANTLSGDTGNDTLNGGAGADKLIGGLGNDLYYVDDGADAVTELADAGTDTVYSYLGAYTLGANVENGRLLASVTASLTGNGLGNVLTGGTGNNSLNGGAGADTMAGGAGADTYSVDNAGDVVTEASGEGTDLVNSYLGAYTLGANVENGRILASGTASLTGNGLGNGLTGGAGNNVLDGGSGVDTMAGGAGNDSYSVDNAGDVVTEASGGGTDLVNSYRTAYTLGANVENGRILASGTASLSGNGLANVLYAGQGNNVLDGGAGVDTASYQYATAAVKLSLASALAQASGGSGKDTLKNIENLTGGAGADSLTGNTGNNSLSGGAGNDSLVGGSGNDSLVGGTGNDSLTGGAGLDALTGGTGNDVFDFNAATETGLSSTTRDTIADFQHGDKIDLSGIDANSVLSGNQAFSFLATATGFSGNATGKLYFNAGSHVLYGSTDADTAAEFSILLTGVSSLTSADFVL